MPIRYTQIIGVSGRSDDCPVYRMSIAIGMGEDGTAAVHQGMFVADIAGVPSPPVKLTHVGLLGRDFLSNVRLLYDGPEREFHLIDYKHVSGRVGVQRPLRAANWRQIQKARRKKRGKRRH